MKATSSKIRVLRKATRKATKEREPGKDGILVRLFNFKREQILEVAARLFYERGYRATTVDAIADELSVTKPFIYYHFKNKEDILQHLFERTLSISLTFFDGIDIENGVPTQVLRQLVMRFVKGVIDSRHSTGVFWRGEKDLPVLDKKQARDFRQRFEAPFKKVLNRGAETGEFRFRDRTVTMLCIEGMINWTYIWYRPEGRLTPEELAERMSELVVNMVATKR
jgi:AcrR family transcriptional regulator